MENSKITQDKLKSLLIYNSETGIFHWINTGKGRRKDKLAGTKNGLGYIQITIDNKIYLAHRLAWLYITGSFPEYEIDHKNNIPNDNRWKNLRSATPSQNKSNVIRKKIKYVDLPRGVVYRPKRNKFEARIYINKKQIYIGQFNTAYEAQEAYNKASLHYYGEFSI